MKLKLFVLFAAVTFFSLGCNTMSPSTEFAQNSVDASASSCGELTMKLRSDEFTPLQQEQLAKIKTRCRIDRVAKRLEVRAKVELPLQDYLLRHTASYESPKRR